MNELELREPRAEVGRYGFFGRRKGHRLRQTQAGLLETLLPRLALCPQSSPAAEVSTLFVAPVSEVMLEIGSGGGEHLLAQALGHPQTGFIGCEPFVNGMAKTLAGIASQGLGNVRLHLGDGLAVARWLPPRCLSGCYILYPDPWPKRRHRKRRLIQDATVAILARPLRSGGFVRLATDCEDYAAWIRERFARSSLFIVQPQLHDAAPWPDFPGTRYAKKAAEEGRRSWFLTALRV